MTDLELDALEARARAAPDDRCCYALAELGQHSYGCDRQRHPARLVVSARDVVWLVDEVRLLREQLDAALADRAALRERANRTETR
jgi:hypothetical protein